LRIWECGMRIALLRQLF